VKPEHLPAPPALGRPTCTFPEVAAEVRRRTGLPYRPYGGSDPMRSWTEDPHTADPSVWLDRLQFFIETT
jgi:hypothetical protein